MERTARVLQSSRIFARLPTVELRRLAGDAVMKPWASGSVVFRQSDAAATVFVVVSGHVGIFLGTPGDYACLAGTAGPRDLLGEAGLVGEPRYTTSARMLAAGELVGIPTASVRRLMSECFDTVLALMAEMSLRIRRQVCEIMDLKMKTAPQRLAGHLAMLTQVEEGPAEVRLPYEKKLLASQLGMQPETLSRALMKLQAVGVSNSNGGGAFALRDVALLRRYAAEDMGVD